MKTFTKSEVLEMAHKYAGGIGLSKVHDMLEAYAAMLPEPPKLIDWSKMPIDTVVEVGDCIRYFAGMEGDCYSVFVNGQTSKTAISKVATGRPKLAPAEMQPWICRQDGGYPFPDGVNCTIINAGNAGVFFRIYGYIDGWE